MVESQRIIFQDQIARNKRNSIFLMAGLFSVIILLGFIIGKAMGPSYFTLIMIVAIIFSIVYIWVGFYNSHKIALTSVNAKLADHIKHRMLYHSVESMALSSGLPMPKVYVMPGAQINAFATGRDPSHAIICVTEGAIEKLSKQELEGVIAHEMGHIANYDIRFMTLTAVLVGMVAIISQIFLRSLWFSGGRRNNDKSQAIFMIIGIVLAILAPIVTYFVQMAISRKREYTADATAVRFQRSPTGLIGALKKIKQDHIPSKKVSKAVAPLFISDPLRMSASGLTSTHPPIEKRIYVLERM
ncbi:MAG: M48 family metallopeptidase [Nanoarchaeota archaeon]|nr:M48 family metallopeptidase [Nanoarchaeota archaeon]